MIPREVCEKKRRLVLKKILIVFLVIDILLLLCYCAIQKKDDSPVETDGAATSQAAVSSMAVQAATTPLINAGDGGHHHDWRRVSIKRPERRNAREQITNQDAIHANHPRVHGMRGEIGVGQNDFVAMPHPAEFRQKIGAFPADCKIIIR